MDKNVAWKMIIFLLIGGAWTALPSVALAFDAGVLAEAKHAEHLGDYATALKLYRKAQKNGEPRDVTVIRISRVLVRQGRVEEAKREIQDFLAKENPVHLEARLALAELHHLQRDYDSALMELDTLERLRPEYVAAKERKGLIYLDQKRYDDAIDILSQYLKLEPDARKARLARAQALAKNSNLKSTFADLHLLLASNPYSLEVLDALGDAYLQAGNHREAEKIWSTALKLSDNSIKFLEKMAETQLKLGKTEKAMSYYAECIQADPTRLDLGLTLAKMHLAKGERQKSIDELNRLLSINPGFDAAQYNLVKIWTAEGKFDVAGSLLREWVGRFPDRDWAALAYAKILVQINRFDLAEAVVRKNVKVSGKTIEPLLYLAYLKQTSGDPEASLDLLKEAEKLYPRNALVKYELGQHYQRTGDSKSAIAKYREVPANSAVGKKAMINLESLMAAQRSGESTSPVVSEDPAGGAPAVRREVASAAGVSSEGRFETVLPGETLAEFSFRVFGTHKQWPAIFDANRDVLTNPHSIAKGMRLRIPGVTGQRPTHTKSDYTRGSAR